MELSAKTEAFLANFAKINQNMLFLEGNTIKTMSEARNVLASANIEENIPKEFGIYDLNEFLRVIALVNPKPSLKFEDDNILFRDYLKSYVEKIKKSAGYLKTTANI